MQTLKNKNAPFVPMKLTLIAKGKTIPSKVLQNQTIVETQIIPASGKISAS